MDILIVATFVDKTEVSFYHKSGTKTSIISASRADEIYTLITELYPHSQPALVTYKAVTAFGVNRLRFVSSTPACDTPESCVVYRRGSHDYYGHANISYGGGDSSIVHKFDQKFLLSRFAS